MNRIIQWKESVVSLVQNHHNMTVTVSGEGTKCFSVELSIVYCENCMLYRDALFFHSGNRVGKVNLIALLNSEGDAAVQWLDLFAAEPRGGEPGGYYYPPERQLLYLRQSDSRMVLWTRYREYDPAEPEDWLLCSTCRVRLIRPDPFAIEKDFGEESPLYGSIQEEMIKRGIFPQA